MIKRKNTDAVHHYKLILKHCDSDNRVYLMQMYSKISIIDPEYRNLIPIDEFLKEISPKNLKGLIGTLVDEFSKVKNEKNIFKAGNLNDSSNILEILNKIFLEDQNFCI
jgi:hypothetical protein